MKSKELLEKYPKAASVIMAHQTDVFRQSLEAADISPEFKEFAKTQELDMDTIAELIDANPRIAFDTFDANQVYIEISVVLQEKDANFLYFVNSKSTDVYYPTRKEAESRAVEAAFEILNNKL